MLPTASGAGSSDEPGSAGTVTSHESPATILVVDDDESTREMIAIALSEEGYLVEQAEDAAKALRKIAARAPDLVLLDVRMPGMSGRELLPRLRQEHPDLPIVLTSADPRLAREGAHEGAAAVLVKPFDLDDLLDIVAGALRGRTVPSDAW
jgi:DNA-binding NtrC family response regulator